MFFECARAGIARFLGYANHPAHRTPSTLSLDTHFIGRIMLDVILSDLDAAHALRPRIETMARELIPTLLTQAFDMAVPPDLHLTLERLDMDLGTLRPDHLEDDMKAALQGAISTRSRTPCMRPGRPSKAARLSGSQAHALTHLESYLATGLLRFQRQARAFDARTQLQFLAANQPADLLAMLRRHRRDRLLLERLMLQAGESGMTELLTVLTPLDKFAIVALLADVMTVFRCVDTPALDGVGETVLRRSLWITTLEFLLNDAGSSFNRRRFLAFLLQREATRLGIDYRSLLHLLTSAVRKASSRAPLHAALPGTLAALLQEGEDAPRPCRLPTVDLRQERTSHRSPSAAMDHPMPANRLARAGLVLLVRARQRPLAPAGSASPRSRSRSRRSHSQHRGTPAGLVPADGTADRADRRSVTDLGNACTTRFPGPRDSSP